MEQRFHRGGKTGRQFQKILKPFLDALHHSVNFFGFLIIGQSHTSSERTFVQISATFSWRWKSQIQSGLSAVAAVRGYALPHCRRADDNIES